MPTVAVSVYYDVGSRNEVPGRSGFAQQYVRARRPKGHAAAVTGNADGSFRAAVAAFVEQNPGVDLFVVKVDFVLRVGMDKAYFVKAAPGVHQG